MIITNKHIPIIRHNVYIAPIDNRNGQKDFLFTLLTINSCFEVTVITVNKTTDKMTPWTLKQCNDYIQRLSALHELYKEKHSVFVEYNWFMPPLHQHKITLKGFWAGWDDKLDVMLFTRDEVILG